ncbi:MAG: hypothetical protein AO394_07140 [Candidatus Fermentibacter daniensis]|nr:MAG: hypothetical protein AO394_07140 [Candidatus Fermentibacter daniensis]
MPSDTVESPTTITRSEARKPVTIMGRKVLGTLTPAQVIAVSSPRLARECTRNSEERRIATGITSVTMYGSP